MRAYSKPTIRVMGSLHDLTQANFAKGVGFTDYVHVSVGTPVGSVSSPQNPTPGTRGYVNGSFSVGQGGYIISAS